MAIATEINPSATRQLLDRARAAARRARAVDPDFARRDTTPHHTAYRRRVAAAFSAAFGVDIADIVLVDDPLRAEWHAVRIELATPEQALHFLAMPGTSNVFLILGPCPRCGHDVPIAETSDLPALGTYLDTTCPMPRPLEYAYDPGHAADCRRNNPPPTN